MEAQSLQPRMKLDSLLGDQPGAMVPVSSIVAACYGQLPAGFYLDKCW